MFLWLNMSTVHIYLPSSWFLDFSGNPRAWKLSNKHTKKSKKTGRCKLFLRGLGLFTHKQEWYNIYLIIYPNINFTSSLFVPTSLFPSTSINGRVCVCLGLDGHATGSVFVAPDQWVTNSTKMKPLDVSDLYTLPIYLDIRTNKPKWLVILYSNDCMWPLCLIIDVTNINDDHKILPLIVILKPSSPLVGNFYHNERTPPLFLGP